MMLPVSHQHRSIAEQKGTFMRSCGPAYLFGIAVALVVSGCGGSSHSSPSPATTAASPPPSTASSLPSRAAQTAPSSEATATSEKRIAFEIVSPQGWEYRGSLPLPRFQARFTTEIRESPPGMAQIGVDITGDPVDAEYSFSDINTGRPNGPTLSVSPGEFAFRLPTESPVNIEQWSQCQTSGNGYAPHSEPPFYYPFEWDIECKPLSGVTSASGHAPDQATESSVTALVAELNRTPPVYVVDLGSETSETGASGCRVYVTQSGHISRVKDFRRGGCGVKRIKVEA
jgi:hypothetical protein